MANKHRKKAVITAKETELASHLFPKEWKSCAFIAAPQVCSTPPRMMKGYIQLAEFISFPVLCTRLAPEFCGTLH